MEEYAIIIGICAALIYLLIQILIYAKSASINKNQEKTIFMLRKILEQNGGKLSESDIKKLNS